MTRTARPDSVAGCAQDRVGLFASIESCIPAMRRYSLLLLGGQEDADDLVHDTLLRALERLDTKRTDGDARPWLFATMNKLFVSRLRKARAGHSAGVENSHGEPSSAPAQEIGLLLRDLVRAVSKIPPEQRVVLLMVSLEDYSYADVADVLGIPVGTVMSRLSRARERLRQIQRAEGDNPPIWRLK
jgi:RNA polymerase sigma factor (sigma-70 family)